VDQWSFGQEVVLFGGRFFHFLTGFLHIFANTTHGVACR
jgi:hypothetical protein